MKNHIPSKIIYLTICLYASAWGGTLYPRILQRIHGVSDDTLFSAPSRYAAGNLGLMILLQFSAAVFEIALTRKAPTRRSYFAVIQTTLLVIYFSFLTFDAFLGDICLHHGPEFEPTECLVYGYGVYPVSLLLIAASWFSIWKENKKKEKKPSRA